MADDSEDLYEYLAHEAVRHEYDAELAFIQAKVDYIHKVANEGLVGVLRKATEFIPYIDAVMELNEIGPAAATSDVNRSARFQAMVNRIEVGTGLLGDATKANIWKDITSMYNGDPPGD